MTNQTQNKNSAERFSTAMDELNGNRESEEKREANAEDRKEEEEKE